MVGTIGFVVTNFVGDKHAAYYTPCLGGALGMALGGMTTTTLRATAITVAGVLLFDVPLNPSSWWLLALGFFTTLAALYGLGMLFASVFLLWGREAWHLVSLLQEPVYLLSGTNFPITVLPRLVALFASAIPLTLGMDAMRTRGLTPGRDITVTGFDDVPAAATAGLTTVRQPIAEKGRLATRQLLDPDNVEPQILLPTELIVRSSSGPAPRR